MNSLWPSRATNDAPSATGKAAVDVTDTGVAVADASSEPPQQAAPSLPTRPPLMRNSVSQPPPAVPNPPLQQPQSPGGGGNGGNGGNGNGGAQQPPDSLSLAQLRRLVTDLPRTEPQPYAFMYEDTAPLDEEVDEWFTYQMWQWGRLNSAQITFEQKWDQEVGNDTEWNDADPEARNKIIADALQNISEESLEDRYPAVEIVMYIVLGRFATTAGGSSPAAKPDTKTKSAASEGQLEAMKAGTKLVAQLGGVETVWATLRAVFESIWATDPSTVALPQLQESQDDLMNLMTTMYIMMQVTLSNPLDLAPVYVKLVELNPSLVTFMMSATAKLRWDDGIVPQCEVFLLLWKSLLLVFGGLKELEETKKAAGESTSGDKEKQLIMASPLDYHVFRQEITSKYPAYIPPQEVIPLEAEHTTLLPQLQHHPTRNNGANGILPSPPNSHAGGASILLQPVHIATPAPSPPPSPGVGGKAGKKQNYQTNQNFPFMYPPLDATSNVAGGKGPAAMQDALVGRKWEGSDVPASILEAGELFSNRVRMTRVTRQLWESREKFLRFDRGWDGADEDIIDELDLSSLTLSEREELGLVKSEKETKSPKGEADYGPRGEVDQRVKQRLDTLEIFYDEALPQLQSVVIVLLKAILVNVAVLISQLPQGQQHPAQGNLRANGPAGAGRAMDGPNGGPGTNGANPTAAPEPPELSLDELDAARTREIYTKAVSGIMLLLLKWLKVSHVLKFEYMTQLLLDCNYVPLLLKLWAHQDIQELVDVKMDRIENSFFHFCNVKAGAPEKIEPEPQPEPPAEPEPAAIDEESEDDCAPPPIKRRRSPPPPAPTQDAAAEACGTDNAEQPSLPSRPEVDEMGYPVNPLPKEPITDFNRRNFFSLINLLRGMQKVCKHKAHRNLLLVHYKSSNILRKMLKVPQPELRLYTLKLFKNQVPYCGRKWRQGNMRVITAIYLHCRPELRDEWLAGSDVDADVEEALPLEQALRSLTHWYNLERYPGHMAVEVKAALQTERDFFVRELEKFEWNYEGDGESMMSEWDGMPG